MLYRFSIRHLRHAPEFDPACVNGFSNCALEGMGIRTEFGQDQLKETGKLIWSGQNRRLRLAQGHPPGTLSASNRQSISLGLTGRKPPAGTQKLPYN